MLLQSIQSPASLESELRRVTNTPSGVGIAVEQAKELVSNLQSELGMSEKDAKLSILGNIEKSAKEDDATIEEVYSKYPAALKEYLQYSPEDLKRNQFVTIAGTLVSTGLFVASLAFGVVAVVRAGIVVGRYLPAILKMLRDPRQTAELSNLLKVTTIEVGRKVALFGVLMPATSALGWVVNAAVNNWNDVFHWGPQNAENQASQIFNQLSKMLGGGGFTQTEKTRVAEYKTAKPKLFTGIIFNGQVGKFDQFVRSVDDEITDDADLKADVEINLLRYISKIPNNLSYSIQIKNSPSDELGIPRSGTWCTLSIYLTNQFHKRVFIDEILLGPVNPFVYYPESQRVEQLQYEIPKLVKFDTLHPIDTYRGQERIVSTTGDVITDVLQDGTRVVAGTSIQAPTVPTMASITAEAEKATPNSISAEGVFQHNQPPLFATLYRLRNGEMLTYDPYQDLTSQAEKERLAQDSSKFFGNEQKLKDRGVNTAQIRAVTFLDLEGVGKYPMRQASFTEFFGQSTTTLDFPKQVWVRVNKLNVRSQPTSQSATAGSIQLTRGDVFTAVAIVEGESVSGNNKWYKSSKGNYVWSGGTSTTPVSVAQLVQEKRVMLGPDLPPNWPQEAVPAPDFVPPKPGTFYIPKPGDFKIPTAGDFSAFLKDI